MISDLFTLTSGLDGAAVLAAVPPSCRRGVERASPPLATDSEILIAAPEWAPRGAARHLLPSFSLLSPRDDYTFRFELSARAHGAWTPWVATATLGPGAFAPISPVAGGLCADVDVITCASPVDRVRLRLRVAAPRASDLVERPWLLTLSACDPESGGPPPHRGADPGAPVVHTGSRPVIPAPPAAGSAVTPSTSTPDQRASPAVALPVPATSQMEAPEAMRRRICSPTCVAMVLEYWGLPASVEEVAASTFHAGLDLYGIWPAAIRTAARHGLLGYLLRFPGWDAAAWCLDRGLPVIASVRYAEGELEGAAVPATGGHLLVLRGYDGGWILVNDPAAERAEASPRRYRLDQLLRAWLGGSGVGYVLFRPPEPR